ARRRAGRSELHTPARRRRHVRGEDHGYGPRARFHTPRHRAPQPRARVVAAHRRARDRRRAPADRVAHPCRRRSPRVGRGAAGRAEADGVRGVSARRSMNAREAAYEVVLRVFEQDAYADRVLRSVARGFDSRERALAQRLAYGTVQRARTLDHAIEQLGRRPVRKLDPPVRAALRLGAYQLAYAEGIAGVDEEAVGEGRSWPQSRGSQLAGLVVGSQPGERTLDVCAAPGGKATQLAGEVVGVEINEARARELEENMRTLQASNVTVVQ